MTAQDDAQFRADVDPVELTRLRDNAMLEDVACRIVRARISRGELTESRRQPGFHVRQEINRMKNLGAEFVTAIRDEGYEVVRGWRPIDTAPDTEDWFLVGVGDRTSLGRQFGRQCWFDENRCHIKPTAWRPIPPAPPAEQQREGRS